jgi:phospholipid/cholesterol/gamma-HCH transport system permease protein
MTAVDERSGGSEGPRSGGAHAAEPKPAKEGLNRSGGSYGDAKTSVVKDAGEIARFSVIVLRAVPGALRFPSEIFRQVGILILTTAPVMIFLLLMLASEASLEAHYLLKQLGVSSYAGIFTAYAHYKVGPIFWGWMLSAKVSCGLVAEFGSMRINEEIDALEVMGINSRSYLLGTRVIAITLFTPFVYLIGMALMALQSYWLNVYAFHTVSDGGYWQVYWTFMSKYNTILSMTNSLVLGTIIILVGCYYGYNAKGGPVGVGNATAKSMIINMIIVSVVGAVFMQLFFGGNPRLPISN